jgi:tetratricopeptide (TPR) repeat protein
MVGAGLALAVAIVFGQTAWHGFVNYDDVDYVYDNTHVLQGISLDGVAWAFTQRHACNWHPLTWLSHMLDCQLFGLWPGGHHLTNVVLHAATVVLLFSVLRAITGRLWASACAAMLFAIHPLRAESVAWVSERKDVLAGLFLVATIAAYAGYARRAFSVMRYLAVLFCLALGLMAKPMLVTVPFVLLLLDYWPLGRMTRGGRTPNWRPVGRLLLEKVPMLALVAVSAGLTLWAQQNAMMAMDKIGPAFRLGNAIVAYSAYLGKLVWPFHLAAMYGSVDRESLSATAVVGSLALLSAISAATVVLRRSHPYLLVGWLWYLGMLVPVIGVVQVGVQTMADRYTYLPQIGLILAMVWGAADVLRTVPRGSSLGAVVAAVLVVALMAGAWRQTRTWRNSVALWQHLVDCTPLNYRSHDYLGEALLSSGRADDAIAQYQAALRLYPQYTKADCHLGEALLVLGRKTEAAEYFQQALRIDPDRFEAHYNLGMLSADSGRYVEAAEHFQRALRSAPPSLEAVKTQVLLADVLNNMGRFREAIEHAQQALQMGPDCPEAHFHLARALYNSGASAAAIDHYREATRLKPNYAAAYNNLGNALLTSRRIEEAIQQYQQAVTLQPDYTTAHFNLGLCLAKAGRRAEAIGHFEQTLRLAEAAGQKPTARLALAEIQRLRETKP